MIAGDPFSAPAVPVLTRPARIQYEDRVVLDALHEHFMRRRPLQPVGAPQIVSAFQIRQGTLGVLDQEEAMFRLRVST